jgi:hypothetical protein
VIDATLIRRLSVGFFYSRKIGTVQFGTFSTASVKTRLALRKLYVCFRQLPTCRGCVMRRLVPLPDLSRRSKQSARKRNDSGMTKLRDWLALPLVRCPDQIRDRRKDPYVALGDHISSCRLVFFEAIGCQKGIERCGVVPDLKQQDVIRVLLRNRDTKLAATQLLYRRST